MQSNNFWDSIKSDYSNVLFRLACAYDKQNKKAFLILGLLEFFPANNGAQLLQCDWQTLNTNKGYRFFYKNFLCDINSAIDFYQNALTQPESPLSIDNQENTIIHGTLEQITLEGNPYLANYESLPFLPMESGVSRILSAYPQNSKAVLDTTSYEKIALWLKDRLCFDIVNDYPEFAGSLHCIFHNPLYRSLNCRLIPDPQESVQFSFETYPQKDTDNLTICMLQEYPHGYIVQPPSKVTENPTVLNTAGDLWKTAYMVWDKKRGLLDFSSFHAFIQKINVEISVGEGRRHVTYHKGEEKIDVETAIYRSASKFVLGEKNTEQNVVDAGERILLSRIAREQKKEAEQLGQYICYNKEEAQKYVISILNKAHNSLIIIDPYFNDEDTVNYLASIKKLDITPKIYVSANSLKQKDQDDIQTWEKLIHVINELTESVKAEFFVMPGDGQFHDRFFIIDNEVYLSGNSLNNIGDRMSVIIRLPEGKAVIKPLQNCKENTTEIHEWIKKHNHIQ